MSLSNSLMYEGRLECGSERTATALLTLPFLLSVQSELSSYSKTDPQHDLAWLQATLLPSNPVCFLDCSMVGIMYAALQAVTFELLSQNVQKDIYLTGKLKCESRNWLD